MEEACLKPNVEFKVLDNLKRMRVQSAAPHQTSPGGGTAGGGIRSTPGVQEVL